MRTTQKRDILELINTLYQAHDNIKNNLITGNYVLIQDMLSQCQGCAINIGETIESSEGENFVTVSYLEEYCDVLYNVYEELVSSQNNINPNKIYKTLRKSLLKIENSIRNDIIVKKEIVFLPYKVSMWDSLESVWRAADADPECDAYVVPISYYEKNPDGSFGKEHYEGEMFPKDVPIVHYKEYNIEKRHPDVAFIHNPYDENNYVTSVHPAFYSDKLKGCCERLIYIPYYVSGEVNPDAPEIMEAKTGFVLSGGVLNSDMVIVQSENTKKLYMNILEKNFPNVDRRYWDKKIQGLGSPKFDRVTSTQRDDMKLPQKWREIIYINGAVRKKIIFYNISIAALLENNDILEKIKDVLNFFKSNQDIALWWRPHPLYESTIASMRPNLLNEYREIVSRYKEEAWGIFDDGVDLEWAIAETDAYYGDSSSVVQLYMEVGKPVMLQDVSVRINQDIKAEDFPVWFSDFCVHNDDIWFVHGKFNALMRYNITDNYTYFIDMIPLEEMLYGAYRNIYIWKNKIFLIPSIANEIVIYSIIEQSFKKLQINNAEYYKGKGMFFKAYARGKKLYCLGPWYEAIIEIDMESEHINYIFVNKDDGIHINDAVRIGNMIVAIYSYTNIFLFFNMDTKNVVIKKIGNDGHQYTSITNIGTDLYLFDERSMSVVKIYGERYQEEVELCKIQNMANVRAISNEQILIDCINSCEMLIMNLEGNIVEKIADDKKLKRNNLISPFCNGVMDDNCIAGDDMLFFSRGTCKMYQFKSGSLNKQYSIKLDSKEFALLKKEIISNNDLDIEETEIYSLKVWAKKQFNKYCIGEEQEYNCGNIILKAIKKL